jgi:hypothetical protein
MASHRGGRTCRRRGCSRRNVVVDHGVGRLGVVAPGGDALVGEGPASAAAMTRWARWGWCRPACRRGRRGEGLGVGGMPPVPARRRAAPARVAALGAAAAVAAAPRRRHRRCCAAARCRRAACRPPPVLPPVPPLLPPRCRRRPCRRCPRRLRAAACRGRGAEPPQPRPTERQHAASWVRDESAHARPPAACALLRRTGSSEGGEPFAHRIGVHRRTAPVPLQRRDQSIRLPKPNKTAPGGQRAGSGGSRRSAR